MTVENPIDAISSLMEDRIEGAVFKGVEYRIRDGGYDVAAQYNRNGEPYCVIAAFGPDDLEDEKVLSDKADKIAASMNTLISET